MSVRSQPQFHSEPEAFKFLEGIVWANGVVCPHCGVIAGRVYDLSGVRGKPSKQSPEGAIRYGLKKCGECRKQFTVKVGTVFEHARMPLHKMLQAVHLIISSKKGISSHQLSRILEVQYKSAWFLAHRIREAMRSGDLAPFGSGGGVVEVDETFIGRLKGYPYRYSDRCRDRRFAYVRCRFHQTVWQERFTALADTEALCRAEPLQRSPVSSKRPLAP